jgi:hypothetical protein
MLDVAGGTNVFADVKQQAIQASTEQILARRPDVILETRAVNSAWPSGDQQAELNVWNAVGSVRPSATTACSSSSTTASSFPGRASSRDDGDGAGAPSRTRSNENLLSWSSGKDSAWTLHACGVTARRRRAPDVAERDGGPRVDARRARETSCARRRRRGPAACDDSAAVAVHERDL